MKHSDKTETRPFNAIDIHNVDVEVEFFGETKPLETWKPDTSDQQKAATNSIAQDEGHKVGHGSANESYETVQCDNWFVHSSTKSLNYYR